MPNVLDDILPVDLGLPEKFKEFRRIQCDIAEYALYGPGTGSIEEVGGRRFTAISAPTGAGKSLFSHALGRMSGMKYVVLTASKALEDQQVDDGFSLVNIRGKANYPCRDRDILHPDARWSCEEGEFEKQCMMFGSKACTYTERVNAAKKDLAVLSNVSYWLHARSKNRQALETKNEKIGLLIIDEFHLAMKALASFLGTWISNEDWHRWANDEIRHCLKLSKGEEWGRVGKLWLDALDSAYIRILSRMSEIQVEFGFETENDAMRGSKEFRKLARLSDSLERIVTLGNDNNWLWRLTRGGIAFDCIWPGRYAERYLWSGVEKIVLLSATLRPKALSLMGLKAKDYWFKEWPRVFPAELSPVYWIPTGRMGHKASDDELEKCVERLDEICDEWGHLKGIVHTASYRRAEWLQSKSRYGRYMIINEPGKATQAAEEHKRREGPSLLVSPSYTTGFDFADSACEFQVIVKLPYADRSDPVTQARIESDPEYYDYETMQTLVQASGRGSRHEKDRCVTLITDDAIRNFRNYARQHAPKWYRVEEHKGVPKAWK